MLGNVRAAILPAAMLALSMLAGLGLLVLLWKIVA
jgi:hypothetical protein